MAEEFQTGICGGTWWNSSRSSFSPCSASGIGLTDHMGSFLWPTSSMVDVKTTTRSCEESNNSVSADSSIVFQSAQKPQPQQTDSDSGGSSILMDSTLQMMSFGLSSSSSPSTDWNQALLRGNGTENYPTIIQEDMNSKLNYGQEPGMDISHQIQKDWSPKSFTCAAEDSCINAFRSINQDFSLDQPQLKSVANSDNSTGLSTGFSVASSTASYGIPSPTLHSLFEQSLFTNRSSNYLSSPNYGISSNELSPTSWPKFPSSNLLKQSSPKQQPNSLHFSNNTPFWNASVTSGLNDNKAGYFPSSHSQFLTPILEEKPNCHSLNTKSNNEEVRDSGSVVKKVSGEPAFKRPRIETPSPLPTFKVRKEKLGDRITALQQLVSPFGKTDTASVLHEAIEYIKFLHDQVSVLSTPYMKQSTPIQQQQNCDKVKDPEAGKQDLRSRGLCLVPMSSTFPVANETTADFWTPTFGGTFR
ncbi:transcription factor bHLH112-like isoform X2 [Pistacia vera]|uniref:transcription factor bHLH112-like isoform X2 n=1 Tax=Pistacia vera TaxID=55513 RepID=UPI0012638D11|nr:transcription factor bHLH112-like isoform X2 [Pistacia vera]XP_031276719.1 transcription factor bHLH112-like isoform X2 [Pistacia vera]XP_031276723.1 transcription factor bHLH112-like isoform X2 [Pistacia vera]